METVTWIIQAAWKEALPHLVSALPDSMHGIRFSLVDDIYLVSTQQIDTDLEGLGMGIDFDDFTDEMHEFALKYPFHNKVSLRYDIYNEEDYNIWIEFFGTRQLTSDEISDMIKLKALVKQAADQAKLAAKKHKVQIHVNMLVAEGVMTTDVAEEILSSLTV